MRASTRWDPNGIAHRANGCKRPLWGFKKSRLTSWLKNPPDGWDGQARSSFIRGLCKVGPPFTKSLSWWNSLQRNGNIGRGKKGGELGSGLGWVALVPSLASGAPPPLPSVYIHTPPGSYTSIKCMRGRGGAGGQGRRQKEVPRRFIHYYFWLNETWGDLPCTSTRQDLASPKNVFLWGVSFYYELSLHGKHHGLQRSHKAESPTKGV